MFVKSSTALIDWNDTRVKDVREVRALIRRALDTLPAAPTSNTN